MSHRIVGRFLTATALTAALSLPLSHPAQAQAFHRPLPSPSVWSWMTDLWTASFGRFLPDLHHPHPAGTTKQGLLIDPNGDPGTSTCPSTGCDPTSSQITPNG